MTGSSFAIQAVPLLLMLLVFYCVVIRPGRVAEGRRWAAVSALVPGDGVTLACGIVGVFVERKGEADGGEYIIDAGSGVRLVVLESGIKSTSPVVVVDIDAGHVSAAPDVIDC